MPSRAVPIGGGSRPRNQQASLQSPPDIIPASLPTSTTTPPYTPGDEFPRRKSRASHVPPPGLMGSSAPPAVIMPPPLQFYPVQPYSSPSDSTSPAYSPMAPRPDQYFTPQSFPMNPYFQSMSGSTTPWQTMTEDEGFDTTEYDFPDMTEDMSSMVDFEAGETASMASASMMTKTSSATLTPSKKRASHTPRPPNAWILYRSDKLKAIAAGEKIPGLEAIMAEMGTSSSGSVSGADSSAEDAKKPASGKNGDMPPPDIPKRVKGKKGAKEPTEGLLSLGRGKGGRGLPQADISKMISMLWKREAQQTRGEYERRAEMKKLEHQEKYPGYKFQPLRRADKIKMREDREREKETLKREKKELARSATRSRRARTRIRASPSSPYSLGTTERYDNLPSQALTYDPPPAEPAPTDQVFWAGGPGHNLPTTQVSVSHSQLGSYPFPMPLGALPSLDNEDTPSFPFALDLSGHTPIGMPSGSDSHQFPPMPEADNALDRGQMQFLSVPQDTNLQQGFGQVTSLEELQQTYDVVPMYLEFPTEGLPPTSDVEQEGVSPGQSADPNVLAALWCMIEEETDEPGPSGLTNDDRAGLVPWDAEARQAGNQWAQQPGMPPPSRFPTLAPHAYSMADPQAGHRAVYDPSGHYLTIPYPQGGQPASFQDGPFLPHQPLSPDQPWPQQSLRSSFSSNVSEASAPTGAPMSYRAPSNAPPPRYVSASQYPPTPVSAGQPEGTSVEALTSTWEEQPQAPVHSQAPLEPMPRQAIPPRGARRGRTVGMKFDGR